MNVSARRCRHPIPAAAARTGVGTGGRADQSFGWVIVVLSRFGAKLGR